MFNRRKSISYFFELTLAKMREFLFDEYETELLNKQKGIIKNELV